MIVNKVKVENNFSEWSTIVKAVRQGLVIEPSALNVFVNDVFHVTVKSAIYNYADDNVLSCAAKSYSELKELLETNLVNMSNWFNANGTMCNPDQF